MKSHKKPTSRIMTLMVVELAVFAYAACVAWGPKILVTSDPIEVLGGFAIVGFFLHGLGRR